MVSGVARVAAGALLLGAGLVVAACATGGPGAILLGFGTDDAGFEGKGDGGGGVSSTSGGGAGDDATGLNSPTGGDDESGVAASGGSGDDAAAPGCDPSSCQSGCCANGACASGMDNSACGQSGVACVDCTATNQVCSFGTCVAGNQSSPAPTDTGTGSSSSSSPPAQMPPMVSTTCNGMTCTNACFPLGLPCCTSAGACGCIALYFLPCN